MNKFTRILTLAMAAIIAFGMSTSALAAPEAGSDGADVTFTVFGGTLFVEVTAGEFSDVNAGSTSTGALNLSVEDTRAPTGSNDWFVDASISEFAGLIDADGNSSPDNTFTADLTWTASDFATTEFGTSGTATVTGTPVTVFSDPGSEDSVSSQTVNGQGSVDVPEGQAADTYTATISVSVAASDPSV